MRWLWVVWIGCLLAACDARYVTRVLVHGESSTDDHEWKHTARVPAPTSPVRWREAARCDAVAAAFRKEADLPAMDVYLREGGALGLVVVHDGTLVCEWYGNGGARERPALAFSVSKTVTSLLLARAVAEGRIHALEDPITATVPELLARDARFGAVTLASLVDMRSGLAYEAETHFPWLNRDAPRVYYASDLTRTLLEHTRIEAPPGRFLYNDYAPNLNALAMQRAYGAALTDGPMRRLWAELGAEHDALWTVDDHGFAFHESGLVVTARDLARVGQLMLDEGKVADRQVAPLAFLTRSLDPAGRAPVVSFGEVQLGYRNGWWIPGADELLGMGRFGQLLYVSRSTRIVIARLGLDGHDETNVSIARRLQRVARRLADSAQPQARELVR